MHKLHSQEIVDIQRPSGFCIVGVEHGKPEPVLVQRERSEKGMTNFARALEQIAKETQAREQSYRTYKGQIPVNQG